MRTHVFKKIDVRFIVSLMCAFCILIGTTASQAVDVDLKKSATRAGQTKQTAKEKSKRAASTKAKQTARSAAPESVSTAPEPKSAAPESVLTAPSAKSYAWAPVLTDTKASSSSVSPLIKEWGPYLDVAFELTYWDKAEIKEWREKHDQSIGEPLAAYIAAWSGKLTPPQNTAPVDRTAEQLPLYRDRDILRLAIAQTIDYLQSDNQDSLGNAAKTIERLKGKSSMPEFAYWAGMIKALQALERDDSEDFVAQVYGIWNNAVLYIEKNEMARDASNRDAATSTPFYYRNLINLVVNRAIIGRKQADLNALGPLFMMMTGRNLGDKDSDGKYITTLVQRIADGLTAPDSDRYRLNFTVAMIESKRLQQVASARLDAEGMTETVQKTFEQARTYNDLCFKWAAGPRSSGVVMAAVDQLDMTSFGIQRLPDNEKAPAYKFFVALPAQDGSSALLKSMAIFNDIATYSAGGWEKSGYQSRELYLKSSHRLWRAIMELALWTGEFYLTKLNTTQEAQSIQGYAASTQVALNTYLNFLTAQQGRGFNDVIPDSAYFGAFEAAEKVSYAYQKVSEFSSDNGAYNLWFTHRLLAAELFPLSLREVRQTSAVLKQHGRYNLYLDYFLPLASRIKQSPAIKKWISGQKPETATSSLSYISNIERLFAGGTAAGAASEPSDTAFVASFQALREEMQRNPDHPTHNLLKLFYLEEIQRNTNFTQLLKDPARLDRTF